MSTPTPVIFIHGLWLHATSWTPWVDLFRDAGYEPAAPGWPGDADTVEQTRANPDRIADHGIDDAVEHYANLIDRLGTKPVLIGHSFGGTVAQKLLGQDRAAAAIAVSEAESQELYERWAIPAPGKPLFEAASSGSRTGRTR